MIVPDTVPVGSVVRFPPHPATVTDNETTLSSREMVRPAIKRFVTLVSLPYDMIGRTDSKRIPHQTRRHSRECLLPLSQNVAVVFHTHILEQTKVHVFTDKPHGAIREQAMHAPLVE